MALVAQMNDIEQYFERKKDAGRLIPLLAPSGLAPADLADKLRIPAAQEAMRPGARAGRERRNG
jgi:uncharacterized lipoprotein